jgi:hypothetical protein
MTEAGDVMTAWVSVPEASARLDVTERTIFRRVSKGKLRKRETSDGRVEVLIDVVGGSVGGEGHDSVMTSGDTGHDAVMTPRADRHDSVMTSVAEWRDDLCQQVVDLTDRLTRADEAHAVSREEAARREAASAHREELSKARVIDLERELTVRDSRMVDLQAKQEFEVTDLRGQVAVLEAKVREVLEKSQDILEKGQDEALGLANRIADLVDRQQTAEARIYELQPVAEQVPMLQAAVEEKDATLSEREQTLQDREQELGNMRQDIDAIASRPVTGPVFRLLTKGRLRF